MQERGDVHGAKLENGVKAVHKTGHASGYEPDDGHWLKVGLNIGMNRAGHGVGPGIEAKAGHVTRNGAVMELDIRLRIGLGMGMAICDIRLGP